VFTRNRDRLLEADVAREFLGLLIVLPSVKRLMSSEHFSIDGKGAFAFGAVTGSTNCSFNRTAASFSWVGSDELDEVSGSGDAEISKDGTMAIDLSFHLGNEATPIVEKRSVLQQPLKAVSNQSGSYPAALK
jgi:hypothetical protein